MLDHGSPLGELGPVCPLPTVQPFGNGRGQGWTDGSSCTRTKEFLDARWRSTLCDWSAGLFERRAKEASQGVSLSYHISPPYDAWEMGKSELTSRSHEWECPQCGKMKDQIPPSSPSITSEPRLEIRPEQEGVASSSSEKEAEAEAASTLPEQEESPATPTTASTNMTFGSEPSTAKSQPPESETPLLNDSEHDHTPTAEPVPEPVPTPTVAIVTPPLHNQNQNQHQHQVAQPAPKWIDGLIVVGLAILATLLYRKISTPSNLIETVSL